MSIQGSRVSQEDDWDIVVVGSGHNGLTAAAYLAISGKRVLVLERAGYAGGGVASFPMAEPGFISERHSAIHQMVHANPMISNDELHLKSKYGLDYLRLDPSYAIIFKNGVLPLYQERERSLESIRMFSAEDAEAYDKFAELSVAIVDLLIPAMFEPPKDMSAAIASSAVGVDIAKATEQCTMELISAYFKNETVKVAILRFVTEIQLAHPNSKGTGLIAFLAIGLLEKYGLHAPRGGGTGFTNSVIRCLEAHGGQVRLNTEVTKILIENGRAVGVRTKSGDEMRAKQAVIAQIHPHILGRFVDGLDPGLVADAQATKLSEFSLFVVHAALTEPLKFNAGGAADKVVMNTICPGSTDDLIRRYDALARGELPENIMIGASCISHVDPTRCPPGQALLHAVVMVRADYAGEGYHGWDRNKDAVVQKVWDYLAKFTTNMSPGLVKSVHVVTPMDHESDSPSFQRGDICGLSMAGSQMGLARPTKDLAQYRVPGVEGLYLAGPFMHPGGGVWGGGRPVAMRVLEDMGEDFNEIFMKGGRQEGNSARL